MPAFVAPSASAAAVPRANEPEPGDASAELAERERRRRPIAEIALVPVPTTLPLVGLPGRDADGYPTQAVDQAGFRSLVMHDEHAALNRYFDELQTAFEADPKKEYWPTGAADSFGSPDRALGEAIDRWVRATPDHFAPLLARATHLEAIGSSARGTKWAKDTSAGAFGAMDVAHAPAKADLERALVLRPKLVAALRLLIWMAMSGDSAELRPLVDRATAICPGCFQVRVSYLHAIAPRWGGSLAAMSAFAAAAPVSTNARLRFLPGFVELERAADLATEGKPAEALAAAEKACSMGEFWPFLAERAERRARSGDDRGALADLDRAVALAPGEVGLRFERARVLQRQQRPEAAANDLRVALRVRPAEDEARSLFERIVKSLVHAAWEQDQAKRYDDALRLFDLAADLTPDDPDIVRRRVFAVQHAQGGADLKKLEAAAKAAPRDFRAHQRFDYALAKQGDHQQVVALWDGFIARVPNEPRAYYERGGALHNLRKAPAALADYDKSCALGSSEGCAAARKAR